MLRCFVLILLMMIATTTIAQYDTLSINLKKGEMYALDYKMISHTSTVLKGVVPGDSQRVNSEMNGNLIFTVKDVLENTYILQAYYNSFGMKSKSPKLTFNFSTEHTDTAGMQVNELEARRTFGKILDQPFYITISKAGNVLQIEGLNELIETIMHSSSAEVIAKQSVAQTLGSVTLAFNLMFLSDVYPKEATVTPGEFWTNNLPLSGKTKAHFVNTYSYSKNDSAILISGKGKLTEYEEMMAMFSMANDKRLESQFSASAILDNVTRWPREATLNQEINIIAEAEGGVIVTNDITINAYYKGRKIE